MCIPFHEVTLLITIHYFEPPDRFELPTPALQVRCSTVKAIEAYVVALVGNDPTTSSTSRKCSPIELQGIVFEHPARLELASLGYKSRIINQLYEGCV